MRRDLQKILLQIVEEKIKGKDSLGNFLADLLFISKDAAYRRKRGETPLTIHEVEKICSHFNISFDALVKTSENAVVFEYNPLYNYDFSLELYLEGIVKALRKLGEQNKTKIILATNNFPLFQLLNFPHLTRFRLYFWAKTHLQIEEYENEQFQEEKLTEQAYNVGYEILQRYVKIPSVECYDSEFLKGLMRQIHYYSSAHLFKDPYYPLQLLDEVKQLADHINEQATAGKKFIYKHQSPAQGCEFDVYLNDTINTDNTFYYSSDAHEGIYLAHNHLNYLHTSNPTYVKESKSVLEKQIANSSLISQTNEKARNAFFHKLNNTIELFRKKIEADLMI